MEELVVHDLLPVACIASHWKDTKGHVGRLMGNRVFFHPFTLEAQGTLGYNGHRGHDCNLSVFCCIFKKKLHATAILGASGYVRMYLLALPTLTTDHCNPLIITEFNFT